MDTDILQELYEKLYSQRYRLQEELINLDNIITYIRKHIVERCEHNYVRDETRYEPCGPTLRVCDKCGHYPY